jgi:hypothetical protein
MESATESGTASDCSACSSAIQTEACLRLCMHAYSSCPYSIISLGGNYESQHRSHLAEGSGVGSDVLGCHVGAAVVGSPVGPCVGAKLGADDGSLVGATVGCSVGGWVGAEVGCIVGASVGSIEGVADGNAVGCNVGAVVGMYMLPIVYAVPPTTAF